MTAPSSLPDDELVRLARAGRRDAFAVLFHRHVARVHALASTRTPDGVGARAATVAVFADLLRHLDEVEPGQVPAALDRYADRRLRGHRASATSPPLTVGAVDAMWRELDRRWPDGEPPRREVGTIVPVTAGALVAVMVLGALASTSRRSGIPDPSRSFEAVAVQHDAPALYPTLSSVTEAATEDATPSPAPEPSPTTASAPPSPEPSTEATPAPTAEPTEAAPTETEAPDEAPTIEIASPSDGSTWRSDGVDEGGAYATVPVEGVAVDDRDPAELLTHRWTSDLEGALAESATASVRLHVPEGQLTATHTLTFTVTDSGGNTASTSVTVVVTRV